MRGQKGLIKVIRVSGLIIILMTAVIYYISYCLGNIVREQADKGQISLNTVRNANCIFAPLSEKAVSRITDITLQNTGYVKWNKNRHQLEVAVQSINVLPDEGNELIVAISLPPDEGIIAVYKKDGSKMVYVSRMALLLPVTGISGLRTDFTDRELLVVNQYHNQMLGAFFDAYYMDVFYMDVNRFKRVLGLITDYNAYWNQRWDSIDKQPYWLWLRQRRQVVYDDSGEYINIISDQALLKSNADDSESIPGAGNFNIRYKRLITHEYRWSHEWKMYILGERTDILTGERVALLEDYWYDISCLLSENRQWQMMKVVNKSGEIKILPAKQLE